MKPKTAKMTVAVVEFSCPCGGIIPHESGAYTFGIFESIPEEAVCSDCGETVKLPLAKVAKLVKASGK
jgi:hypothetical protein